MSIGNRILELRRRKNISLTDLMKLTGFPTDFLFDLENDRVPFSKEDISKIAYALGVHKNDIFYLWEPDQYEDFYNAKTDEDRLLILNSFGVPEDLLSYYLELAFQHSKQQIKHNPTRPANTEPEKHFSIYKSGLFWTVVGVIIAIAQLFKD